MAEQPPLTNRGVVRPDDRAGGGVDYLKLTVWGLAVDVCDVIGRGVLDAFGWSSDRLWLRDEWTSKPSTGRVERIYDGGCVQVLDYRDEVSQGGEFCSVEVKGQGCEHLGNEGVQKLLSDLAARFYVRASRVDVMAHTEAFSPRTVERAVRAGDVRSRAVTPERMVVMRSAGGDTCYLGMVSKEAGGMKRCGDRCMRVYNLRGPTRVELQMQREAAHGAGDQLARRPLVEWPDLIRGLMRHYCDFIDAGADPRPTRCPLTPWWRAFVGNVEKISVRPSKPATSNTPLAAVDALIKRSVKRLYAAQSVFGAGWITDRINEHAKWLEIEEFADHITELEPFLGTGLYGVPEDGEEPPI